MVTATEIANRPLNDPLRNALDEAYTLGVEYAPDRNISDAANPYEKAHELFNKEGKAQVYTYEVVPRLTAIINHLDDVLRHERGDIIRSVHASYRSGYIDTLCDSVQELHYKPVFNLVDEPDGTEKTQ